MLECSGWGEGEARGRTIPWSQAEMPRYLQQTRGEEEGGSYGGVLLIQYGWVCI